MTASSKEMQLKATLSQQKRSRLQRFIYQIPAYLESHLAVQSHCRSVLQKSHYSLGQSPEEQKAFKFILNVGNLQRMIASLREDLPAPPADHCRIHSCKMKACHLNQQKSSWFILHTQECLAIGLMNITFASHHTLNLKEK